MRKEVIGNATLYLGDNAKVLPTLAPVDAVVTSPPYKDQRHYGGGKTAWDVTMLRAFIDIPAKDACQVLVNLGQLHESGEVDLYWSNWLESMRRFGWRFFGWYVWDQGFGLPGDWAGRLAPSHEFVFHFNRKPIEPNKWVKPKSVGRVTSGTTMRKPDGKTPEKKTNGEPIADFKVADSVIRVTREMRRDVDHPALFPVRLPEELLMSFTQEGDTVLDPFMGAGTTGVACANQGRAFVGVEIHEPYFDIACERIENAQRQERLFA